MDDKRARIAPATERNGTSNGNGNGTGTGSLETGNSNGNGNGSNGHSHGHGHGHGHSHGHSHLKKHGSISGHTTAGTVAASDTNASDAGRSGTPKKRRKVNHACVYCRRSHMTCDLERPCTRCVKRNIGHLCHDEPRDSDSRKSKSVVGTSVADESEDFSDPRRASIDHKMAANAMPPPSFDASNARDAAKPAFNAAVLGQTNPMHLVRPGVVSGLQPNPSDVSQFAGFSDAWLTAQSHFDMHNHNGYMIVPEVSGELQFLNDFLHSSMVDDAAFVDDQHAQLLRSAPPDVATSFLTSPTSNDTGKTAGSTSGTTAASLDGGSGNSRNEALISPSTVSGSGGGSGGGGTMLPPSALEHSTSNAGATGTASAAGTTAPRTPLRGLAATAGAAQGTTPSADKAREYYLTAADPSGNDTPEQRMSDLLKAKYEAGLLKPFNYVNGYARLRAYLDSHQIAPSSKQKIQRQLDRFRPKFREKMQALTDLELVYVEMWFERTLMEYDRVFASMAVPACCWRRTGEIFRGNKEMAELIHVPVENLRDGKIAIHEILTQESVVRYWEEFGTIAFDAQHDTLLTACSIKRNLDDDDGRSSMGSSTHDDAVIKCCFSLKIRRDDHKIPSLIVGNFLPHDPLPH